MLTLNTTPSLWKGPPKLFNRTTDHKKIHDLLNEEIKLNTKLKISADIDSAVNSLTTIIQSAAWSATNYDTNPLTHKPLPEVIRTKIVEKRKARALYQRTRLPSYKHILIKQASANIKVSSKLKKIKPWATTELIKAIRDRDQLHLKVKKHNNNENLKKYYKNFRNKVTQLTRNAKNLYYKSELEKANGNPKMCWKLIT